MRNFLIGIVIFMFFKNPVNAQNNYLNSRFAVISSKYKWDCYPCEKISKSLHAKMKDKDIFQYQDEFPNWEEQKNNNFVDYKVYDIDFYLISEVERSTLGFQVVFTLWEGAEPTDRQFISIIKSDKSEVEMVKVSRDILEELRRFKLNGRFKKMILVDNFRIVPEANELVPFSEGFSNWLAGELRDHEVISLNYRVFYHKNFDADVSNTLGGEFYPQENKKYEMKMKIEIILSDDKPRRSKPLTIDMMEYENNINDILDAINSIIKKYERRT